MGHEADLPAVLERAHASGVEKIIVTAGCLADVEAALAVCADQDWLYTTVGVHPTRAGEFEGDETTPDEYLEKLLQLATDNKAKVVAIGEFGLDFDRLQFCDRETQIKYFERQFELAEKTKLPLFLHNRNTDGTFVEMIRANRSRFGEGVVHSFDGSMEEMLQLVELGLYIGINGCSLRAEENLAVVAAIPLERLMIETDAPWCDIRATHASHQHVTTTPYEQVKKPDKWTAGKGVKGRNEPAMLVQVLEVVAAVHQVKPSVVAEHAWNNTTKVFFPEQVV